MERLVKKIHLDWSLFLVVILSFFSIISLFHTGLPPTHDGEYHVVRFYEFDKTLRSGSWYPLWAPDLNYTYGSPLFNYVYPLPNYVSSLFHLFGVSFIDSFKLNLILASLIGSVSSYFLGKQKFGIWGGVLTSVFYTYAPYHFLDIYIRGSVGEVWALAFFPLCLLALEYLVRKKTFITLIFFGITYSLVIFSHNILAVMFSFFAGSYGLLLMLQSQNKKKTFLLTVGGFFAGLFLSSVFILPALLEQNYVVGLNTFNVLENFPDLFELLVPSWGSGFSGAGIANQMSFQIGLANLLVVFLILVGFILRKVKKGKLYLAFFLLWFFALCFLVTPYSGFIWVKVPFMVYVQFPWRLLSLVVFVCAILAGSIVTVYKSRFFYILLIGAAMLLTLGYSHPPYFFDRQDDYYTTKPNFIYGTNSMGDAFQTKWFPQQKNLPKTPLELSGASIISKNAVKQIYSINLTKKERIVFNMAYFPGWNAYIDGKRSRAINKHGTIQVQVPRGSHVVALQLEDTLVRFIAKSISILTILTVLCILGREAVIQLLYGHRHR